MINKLIEYSVNNRWMVLIVCAILLVSGLYVSQNTAVDAIPDLSDVQVIIQTDYSGQPPQVVEDQVTYPLSTAMLSVPKAKNVRGYSFFGTSFVYIIFEDGTDIYWARSRVLEYLSQISGKLPESAKPQLGPDATGVGWVYQYALVDSSNTLDLSEIRSIQDWFLKPELSSVQGVSEVASIGGFVRQYQIEVDPRKLEYYDIHLPMLIKKVKESQGAVGGKIIELGETEFMVRSMAYIGSLKDLESVPVKMEPGKAPILLSSVANITLGPEIRRGLSELDGKGEVVGGIIVARFGANAREVIANVKAKLKELQAGMPEGLHVIPVYDRSILIDSAVDNLVTILVKETLIVALITFLFLLHFRSTFIAVITLPVGIGISLILMNSMGINANIMSLGGIAIAIGVMVDASIVMVENAFKHLEHNNGKKDRIEVIIESAKEVGPALFFSLLIITVSFLPVLVLEGQAGKLFKPLAFTKTFAMASSAVLAITLIPALIALFLKGKIKSEKENPLSKFFMRLYRPVINFALKFKKIVLASTVLVLLVTIYPLSKIGSEFMPPLYEGDLLYMPTTLPGISVGKARELLQQTDRIIASFPEVKRVFGKIGRAETATDPAPLTMIETTIMLKPMDQWRDGMTVESLIDSLDKAIQFPGLTNAWTMPIKTRIDMLSTGIKTALGIKIMGPDLDTLNVLAQRIESAVKELDGIRSVYGERVTGGNYLDIKIDRFKASSYGLTVKEIQAAISTAIGGMNIGQTIEGLERYPISVRYPREFRDNPEAIKRVLVYNASGMAIPLGQVTDIGFTKGAPMIKSENARPTAWVYVDVKDSDLGGFVKKAKEKVNSLVDMPNGYSLVWSGQYENMQEVDRKLKIIVPLTLIVILMLLYLHFKSLTNTLIVALSLPFALVGGIWLFYLFGFNLSIAVFIGFIALAGLATETGIVMLVYLEQSVKNRVAKGEYNTSDDVREAVIEGAVERLRPKLMTVATTLIGLLPIMFGTGVGSEVMQRIAAPMVGGLISSTVLTLIIIPVIYEYIQERKLLKSKPQ